MKIYFIQQGDDGPIKIGISWNVERRLDEAKIFSPHPLRILAIMPGDSRKEKLLHRKFKSERLKGEWFKPSEKVIQYIQTLQGNRLSLQIDGVKLTTPLELAGVFQIQVNRILNLAKKGKLPCVKFNGAIYFKKSEIETWTKNFEMSQNPPQADRVVKLRP